MHRLNRGTLLGIIAILLWSTMLAAFRALAEALGPFTAMAGVFTLGGGLGLLYLAAVRRTLPRLLRRSPGLLAVEGLCVLVYLLGFNASVGSVKDSRQVLALGILNYLWPAATLVFCVPLLHYRARWGRLALGTAVALAGVGMATLMNGDYSLGGLIVQWRIAWLPYLAVIVAALSWGVYSALARRWADRVDSGGMPLFLLATGLVMFLVRGALHESSHWTPAVAGNLLYTALGPTLIANTCWDAAMRGGRIVLLTSLSYLIPLLTLLVLSLSLRTVPGPHLWIACGLVIAGAVVCHHAVSAPVGRSACSGDVSRLNADASRGSSS